MAIQRLRVEWQGTAVEGPGLTTFYGEADGSMSIQVGAAEFFQAVSSYIMEGTTITIPGGGDLIDEATGELTGVWGSAPSTTITGGANTTFASGVGGRVVWETGAVRNGRRVRGSTFVVPLSSGAYESNGTLTAAAITAMETAADGMLTQAGGRLVVWSRPKDGRAGAALPVAAARVPDRVSWLRSRRT